MQFVNQSAQPQAIVSEPSWGFAYNSVPFGLTFGQMLQFLHTAKVDILRVATTAYLGSLTGPSEAAARTEAQREVWTVLDAMTRFGAAAGATKLDSFPGTTGLAPGEVCRLAP